jgi:hypothetical protein
MKSATDKEGSRTKGRLIGRGSVGWSPPCKTKNKFEYLLAVGAGLDPARMHRLGLGPGPACIGFICWFAVHWLH